MTKKQKHQQKDSKITIIVGPTAFKWKAIKASLKHENVKILFVDGGLSHLPKFQKSVPHLVRKIEAVGDGDSSKRKMTIKKTDQNQSDLTFCLHILSKQKDADLFLFVGFLGGRIDHQFFNLGEISRFVKKTKARIVLDDQIEFFRKGKFSVEIQGLFSLASFEEARVKIDGACLYKSKKWLTLLPLSSLGLSNVGSGKIDIESTSPLAIFY